MGKPVTSVRCPRVTTTTKECLLWNETKQEVIPSLPRRTILCQRAAEAMDSSFLMVETKVMVKINKGTVKPTSAISHSPPINRIMANETGKQHNPVMDFNFLTHLQESSGNVDQWVIEWKNSLSKFPPILPQPSQS